MVVLIAFSHLWARLNAVSIGVAQIVVLIEKEKQKDACLYILYIFRVIEAIQA